ncbi:MAG: hypothetical protein AMXMBFR84_09940 [Candidatus Hydrogenedentota bacterium]
MQVRVLGTLFALLSTFTATLAHSGEYPAFHDSRLNDFAGIIRSEHAEQIRDLAGQLRESTGIQAVVVTIQSIGGYGTGDPAIEPFATKLFNAWGVGRAERNDGVMLLVSVDDRAVRIEVGSGYGNRLDRLMQGIIDREIIPAFKRGDYSTGILEGTLALCGALETEGTAATQDSPAAPAESPVLEVEATDPSVPVLEAPVAVPRTSREESSIASRQRVRTHRPSDSDWGLTAVLTLLVGGSGAALVGLFLVRSNRCPHCKRDLVLLDPGTDHERLDDGQQLEERLNTVDYQFFRCPQCGYETMAKRRRFFSSYGACPQCSYRTLKQEQRILSHPTRHSTGTKVVTQDCEHCSYHDERTIVMPQLPSQESHVGHGGIGGGFRGGGGSSGGSHGGGFGGGRSSGGGASGRW